MAHVVSLVAGLIVLLFLARDQWFHGDEWDFLADRTITGGQKGLFAPHNEHWSTIPILIFGLVFSFAGLKTYLPYEAVLLLFHLAVVHLLWRVMRRCGVDPWIAVAAGAVFVVFGPGADNILWAFQIGFVGPLVGGLLQIVLLDRAGPFGRRDASAVAVGAGSLLFSGIAVPMVATAGAFALIRRGWRVALTVVAVPAAVYLVWLATAGAEGLSAHPAPSAYSLARVPQFVWTGLASPFEVVAGSAPAAVAVAAGVAVLLLLRLRRGVGIPVPAATLAAGAILLLAVVAVGRTAFAVETARTSRYVYLVGALLLPLVAVALTELVERTRIGLPAALALLGLAVVGSFVMLQHRAERQAADEDGLRRAIFAARDLAESGAVVVNQQLAAELDLPDLDRLAARGALPEPPALTDRDRLIAALNIQVALSDRPEVSLADGSVRVQWLRGATVVEHGRCATLRPGPAGAAFALAYGRPSSLPVRSPTIPAVLEVFLRPVGEPTPPAGPRELPLDPGPTMYLNLAAPGVLARVRVPPVGQFEVCEANPWPVPAPVP